MTIKNASLVPTANFKGQADKEVERKCKRNIGVQSSANIIRRCSFLTVSTVFWRCSQIWNLIVQARTYSRHHKRELLAVESSISYHPLFGNTAHVFFYNTCRWHFFSILIRQFNPQSKMSHRVPCILSFIQILYFIISRCLSSSVLTQQEDLSNLNCSCWKANRKLSSAREEQNSTTEALKAVIEDLQATAKELRAEVRLLKSSQQQLQTSSKLTAETLIENKPALKIRLGSGFWRNSCVCVLVRLKCIFGWV